MPAPVLWVVATLRRSTCANRLRAECVRGGTSGGPSLVTACASEELQLIAEGDIVDEVAGLVLLDTRIDEDHRASTMCRRGQA